MHAQRKRSSAAAVLFLVAVLLFAGLLMAVPRAAATHDTVTWSQTFWVASTGNDEGFSSVLADGNGTFYVFYLRTDSGTGETDVYESKWTTRGPSGVPEGLQSDRRVNDVLGAVAPADPIFGLPATPYAAIDHTGNVYVVWTSSAYDIYVSKSTNKGLSWLPAVKANSATATAWDFAPSIAITGSGLTERIWVSYSQLWITGPAFFNNATVSYSVNQGSTFIGYTNASGQDVRSTFILTTDLAADSQARLYLTYTAIDFSTFGIYANYTWSDTGTTWASPWALNTTGGGFFPVVRVDAKDRVHLAWLDAMQVPNGMNTIFYMRSDTRGASWTPRMPVNQGTIGGGGGPIAPVLIIHGDTVMVTWDGQRGFSGIGYAISADGGNLWYPEAFYAPGFNVRNIEVASDENGTFYATWTYQAATLDVGFVFWDSPPSRPAITDIARGTGSLTVRWSLVPEKDVAAYRVWRAVDGSTYELIATVPADTTMYLDSVLANGTYWYKVTAVDMRGTSSHDSLPVSGTVGPTLQERVDALEAEIVALQTALATAQSDIDALQTQLTSLQSTLNQLQTTVNTNDAAMTTQLNNLKTQLDNLQSQLSAVKTEQATQTMSYVNLGFEILVVVLLALLFLMQMRKPKTPTMMMADPPTPLAPKKPDDEL